MMIYNTVVKLKSTYRMKKLQQYLENRNIDFEIKDGILTVGGYLDLEGTQVSELDVSKIENQSILLFSWRKGKYIMVDDMFCEVIKKIGKAWKCKKINKKEHFYIVTDGNGKYSHGKTVREAKEDLLYKIGNRNKDQYKHLTPKSILSFEKMVECYRVITGACGFGVKDFVESNNIEKKDYSIKDIIALTKNSYGGSSFENFFIS